MNATQKVMEAIADTLGVDKAKINLDTVFDNGLSLDEMHRLELVMAIEEEFSIEIPDEDAERFAGVSDITEYVEHRIC